MIPENYDIWVSTTDQIPDLIGRIHTSLTKRWPKMCGYIELDNESDLSFENGEFSTFPLPPNCKGAYFSRDQDMFQNWDWGSCTSEQFEGEGPVSIFVPNFTDSISLVCISLPENPDRDPFSRQIFELVTSRMLKWTLEE